MTVRKEFEIEGVSWMRFNQFKNKHFKYNKILCADVFCGTGTNDVGGEIVDGSPVRLLNAYIRSSNTRKKHHADYDFWFSDIRKSACKALRYVVEDNFPVDAEIHAVQASDAINILGDILHQEPDTFLYLILDPNGPKEFPKYEVEGLISNFSPRIDVIPYISATTINRCIGARNNAGMQFKNWIGQIENFDTGFVSSLTQNNRCGWIRKPCESDRQRWTMIPTFGCFRPMNDWEKQGYVYIQSEEGRKTIKHYCGRF